MSLVGMDYKIIPQKRCILFIVNRIKFLADFAG